MPAPVHQVDMQRMLGICLAIILIAPFAAACSSRTMPQPRPTIPTITTARPNITFPIFNCPPTYAAWYCLNDATCFTVEIHSEILYNCECANGYMGPRCEYKEIDGSYLPTRQRAMLQTASIATGATLAVVCILMVCIMLYIRFEKNPKLDEGSNGANVALAHDNMGLDEVDFMTRVPTMRPFGEHHYHIKSLAETFRR